MMQTEIGNQIASHPDLTSWRHTNSAKSTLGIIIPYRDREEHLRRLLPHLVSFFQRDVFNRQFKPLIVISEQTDNRKFNRGWCKNGGFFAVQNFCDYICFHDVDYLPMWADYSYSPFPTRIVWWGMNARPLRTASDNKKWLAAAKTTFGAVVVLDKSQFLRANGYSNEYHGWGFEDDDLKVRLQSLGLPIKARDGTFIPLDHDHEGYTEDCEKNQDCLKNETLFESRRHQYQELHDFSEGLNTMRSTAANITFERWPGLDKAESQIICRLKIHQV